MIYNFLNSNEKFLKVNCDDFLIIKLLKTHIKLLIYK